MHYVLQGVRRSYFAGYHHETTLGASVALVTYVFDIIGNLPLVLGTWLAIINLKDTPASVSHDAAR